MEAYLCWFQSPLDMGLRVFDDFLAFQCKLFQSPTFSALDPIISHLKNGVLVPFLRRLDVI